MIGEYAAWARIGIGAVVLVVSCVVRDIIVWRRDTEAVNEAMRRRR
jgi:hypothetical protein